jgi:hypothetical protein
MPTFSSGNHPSLRLQPVTDQPSLMNKQESQQKEGPKALAVSMRSCSMCEASFVGTVLQRIYGAMPTWTKWRSPSASPHSRCAYGNLSESEKTPDNY